MKCFLHFDQDQFGGSGTEADPVTYNAPDVECSCEFSDDFTGTGTVDDPISLAPMTVVVDLDTVCAALEDAPDIEQDQVVTHTLGFLADGTCVKVPAPCWTTWPDSVTYADGPGAFPVNAADFRIGDKPTMVCVTDGPNSGVDEFWIILDNAVGESQWRQMA